MAVSSKKIHCCEHQNRNPRRVTERKNALGDSRSQELIQVRISGSAQGHPHFQRRGKAEWWLAHALSVPTRCNG